MATVTQTNPTPSRIAADSNRILPLHSGDRLTAEEFERRYSAMPGVQAELIEGVVYVASPVSVDHSESHLRAMFWMAAYLTTTPFVAGGDNGTIRLDLDNQPQPDGYLRVLPEGGGRAKISEDRYVVGAPEFVIEIARSSASYDLHDKLNAYRRNQVLDYVVWQVEEGIIQWFSLRGGRYERIEPTPEGHYHSPVLPGLWLDPSALLRGDLCEVLRVVQLGLASPEHTAFVAKLQETAAKLAAPAASNPEATRP